MTARHGSGLPTRGEVVTVGLLALALRVVFLDHTPYIDELYHMLAAGSLLGDGTLDIPGGEPYTRARMFTYVVAAVMGVLGQGLVQARLVALVGGVALVVALFMLVRRVADRTAAWVSAVLLAAYPAAIQQSQLVRFYTWQVLLFLVGAAGVYALVHAKGWSRGRYLGVAIGTVAALGMATHLQILTLVGLMALGIWVVLVRGRELWSAAAALPGGRWWVPFVFAAGAAGVFSSGLVDYALEMTNKVDLWAIQGRGEFRVYHRMLLDHYPTLWTLFPLAVVVAMSTRPRPAFFCATVFSVAFIYHSVAAWKVERYILYIMPFFFTLVGLAVSAVLPALLDAVTSGLRRIPGWSGRERTARGAAIAIVSLAVLFAVASNGAFRYTVRMLTTSDADWPYERLYRGEADWEAVAPVLRRISDDGVPVVSSSGPKAIYYLDRLDYILVANELRVVDGRPVEFAENPLFARPVISRPESVARLVECLPRGLIVVERKQFGKPFAVPIPTREYIRANTTEIELDQRYRVRAFEWRNVAPADDGRCAGLESP